jgi:hypothetical protein
MKKLLIALSLVSFSGIASATCYGTGSFQTCYDAQSGNNYQIQRYGNTTQMYGSNPSTGSNWSQTTNRIGNTTYQNGYDSNGNSWNTTRQDYGNGNYTINGTDSQGNSVNQSCFGGLCN